MDVKSRRNYGSKVQEKGNLREQVVYRKENQRNETM